MKQKERETVKTKNRGLRSPARYSGPLAISKCCKLPPTHRQPLHMRTENASATRATHVLRLTSGMYTPVWEPSMPTRARERRGRREGFTPLATTHRGSFCSLSPAAANRRAADGHSNHSASNRYIHIYSTARLRCGVHLTRPAAACWRVRVAASLRTAARLTAARPCSCASPHAGLACSRKDPHWRRAVVPHATCTRSWHPERKYTHSCNATSES